MIERKADLEILSIHSADVDLSAIDPNAPPNSATFEFEIGVPGGASSIYSILFVSNAQAKHMRDEDRFISLPLLSEDVIRATVQALLDDCLASERPEEALRRIFHWEYEGYKG